MNAIWEKIKASPLKIAAVTTFVLIGIYLYYPVYFLEYLEGKTLDVRLLVRGQKRAGSETVLVTIDEASLNDPDLGRWPWDRDKLARGIKLLNDYGARVIALDIVFAEPQRYGKGDQALAEAIAESDRVVLGYFLLMSKKELEHLSVDQIKEAISQARRHRLINVRYTEKAAQDFKFERAYYPQNNITMLDQSVSAAGYFNMMPDPDGTVRKIPMLLQLGDNVMPSLSLQILKKYFDLDSSGVGVELDKSGVVALNVGDIELPVSLTGELLVNYYGPGGTFPHYSFKDIYREKLSPQFFQDKIVIIGATATGIYDMRVTPFDKRFPGMEVHANAVDNILHRDFIRYLPFNILIDVFLIFAFGFLLAFIIGTMSATIGGVLSLAVLVAYIALAQLLFSSQGIALNIVFPSVSLFVSYTGITFARFRETEKEKKQVRQAFQSYLSEAVVKEVLKDPSKLKLGGEKKELTVLFSDIRGFTSISESLEPETLHEILNQYLTAMTDVVFRYEGTLDKYIGDAIMAVFGAPLPLEDHPLKACMTALDMLNELKILNMKWKQENIPLFDVGIGINTGAMVVGNLGSERLFDYTVIGDNVNLGSRLEGLNKEYRTRIIISEATYKFVQDEILCRELDLVAVKGKTRPVKIYEVLTTRDQADGKMLKFVEMFSKGIRSYHQREFSQAIEIFDAINKVEKGDAPSRLYIQRCLDYMKSAPSDDWDGVFRLKTK